MQPLVVVSRDIVGVPEIAGIMRVLAGLNESADEVRFGLPLASGTEVATSRATVILNPLAAELHELASMLAIERVPSLPSAGVGFMLAARMRELNEAQVICHGVIPLSRSHLLLASGCCSADLAASVPQGRRRKVMAHRRSRTISQKSLQAVCEVRQPPFAQTHGRPSIHSRL